MTNTEAIAHLYRLAIQGQKAYHPGYEWSVEYAKKSKAHFAGVGIDEYLQQFARRESDELFEQRKLITKHVQKSLGAMLERPFSKAARSNWTKILAFDNDTKGERSQSFQRDVLGRFTQGGLDKFIFERIRYWSKFDPNAFVVVEFESTDGTKRAKPYPFEVRSDMAIDFTYSVHGDLEFLAVLQSKPNTDKDDPAKQLNRLTMYRPLQTVVLQQLSKAQQKAIPVIPAKSETITGEVSDGMVLNTGEAVYLVVIPQPHKLPVTPAIRTGFIENPADDGQTRVGIFDAALPFAEKIVKINSELDIVTAFLAFPVSVRYEETCGAIGCIEGHMADGGICITCKGTGFKPRPTSAQEEILLPMPRRPEDAIDLTKILHYTYPPAESVKMQVDMMKNYFEQAKESVFNSQMFTKQETAQTATFHGIELQSIYDTLYPYAQNLAQIWRFVAEACQAFTGFQGAMTAALIFPHDFRFETADDLFNELKLARDAEAGNDSTAYLDERIMERLLIDDPERLNRWRIDNAYNPFKGMTETQIVFALSSGMVPEWKKVWWINRADIMADILQAQPDFYMLEAGAQRKLIRAKVDELQAEMDAAKPALILDMNPQPNAAPGNAN